MPGLAAVAFASYGLRYARWHWLLRRAGHGVPAMPGFAGYLAGFAFTATPGKVGEPGARPLLHALGRAGIPHAIGLRL